MRPLATILAVVVSSFVSIMVSGTTSAQMPGIVTGPRPQARVVDETGTLSAADRAEIERLARSIQETTKADLMVVVLSTTAGAPHRRFATDLFNRWQLGSTARNDGLLLFVALADRKSEIILGDGLDTTATRAAAQRIMEGTMIPHFRAGRPGRAILEGATHAVTDIVGVSAEQPAAGEVAPLPVAIDGNLVEKRPEPILEPLVDAATTAPIVPPGNLSAERPMPPPFVPHRSPPAMPVPWGHGEVRRPNPSNPFLEFVLLAGGGGATLVGGSMALRNLYRYRRRGCPHCGTAMIRLSEQEDDDRLAAPERLEENLGSVDYDVWTCPVCPAVEKVRWGAIFTRYAKCPRCRAITKSQTISRVRAPTRVSEGLERIDERCLHCGWEKTSQRIIPQLPEPTRSSVDWSAGSSSSSHGSSSSGSSGGHSSGGGASGSW